MRPGASPQSRGYIYTGPGEVSSLVTDPPVTPVTPRIYIYIQKVIEVLHLYRCVTHTPCLWQGGATENEVKMKMRGKWRWGDLEDEMKNYLTRTRRGERKRRRREHQHDTPGPERANPGKAREKKSGGSTDTEQDQRRGGEGRKRLNQPDTARTYTHLSTRRSQPTWGGKNARDRGPMGISWWKHKKKKTRLSS